MKANFSFLLRFSETDWAGKKYYYNDISRYTFKSHMKRFVVKLQDVTAISKAVA